MERPSKSLTCPLSYVRSVIELLRGVRNGKEIGIGLYIALSVAKIGKMDNRIYNLIGKNH